MSTCENNNDLFSEFSKNENWNRDFLDNFPNTNNDNSPSNLTDSNKIMPSNNIFQEEKLFGFKIPIPDNFNLISDNQPFNPKSYVSLDNVRDNNDTMNHRSQSFSLKRTEKTGYLDKKTDCNKIKNKCGRKTKREKENYVLHDKFHPDNIIRKIKVHIIQEKIISLINNYFSSKKLRKKKLFKLIQGDVTRLKRENNMKFMNTSLKDIYLSHRVGKKYSEKKANNNQLLIQEIYSEDKYIELQKLLNLTFHEFYEIYTHNLTQKELSEELNNKKMDIELLNNSNFKGIETYIEKLEEKQVKKNNGIINQNIKDYVNEFKNYCGCFREWFVKKVGRNEEKFD